MKTQRARGRSDRPTLTAEYLLVIATIIMILTPTFVQLNANACNVVKAIQATNR